MVFITGSMKKQASLLTLVSMVALFSHTLVIPVMSTVDSYSPKPSTSISPSTGGSTAGDTTANINCNNPPHGGGGGGGSSDNHHSPSTPSGHHGGGGSSGYHYSPPPYTPITPTPKTPIIVSPPTDPHIPTPSIPTPSTPTYTPRTPTVAPPTDPHTPSISTPSTPPLIGTPPIPFVPITPPSGTTPPFSFDPSSPAGPFPCTYWRMHPTMIWGLMGWNGNSVSSAFGVGGVAGFGSGMNLLEALSNTRTDGFGELYREGTAALLNAMASKSFPYSAQQVKLSFSRAVLSSNGDAAAAQARLFKMANEGHFKLASP